MYPCKFLKVSISKQALTYSQLQLAFYDICDLDYIIDHQIYENYVLCNNSVCQKEEI